jgi:hypothetical protein
MGPGLTIISFHSGIKLALAYRGKRVAAVVPNQTDPHIV